MNLLAVRLARAVWSIPPYFLNPKGVYMRPIIEGLKSRYGFSKTPLDGPIAQPGGNIKFEDGAFSVNGGAVAISQLSFLDSAIVVDTRSTTENADSFLIDAIGWASKEYGIGSAEGLPIRKYYLSELNVGFDKELPIINQKLKDFISTVSSVVGGNADFLGLQVGTDPTVNLIQGVFKFEREAMAPHTQNRYYSMATTTTKSHLKLLEGLEAALI